MTKMTEIDQVILANQLAIMKVLLFMAPDAETDLEKRAVAELIAAIADTTHLTGHELRWEAADARKIK